MDEYSQPDEGYSEDPLNSSSIPGSFSLKSRDDRILGLSTSRPGDRFPAWLTQHIASLSIADKTDLAMALLHDLPTGVISEIVQQLNPRLYIDFVRYLPPEVCLKILGYLDPVSLIHVARTCRAWNDLALDRKLWQQLYYTEGWRAKVDEVRTAERQMNERDTPNASRLQRILSEDDGHARKKRAISLSPRVDSDVDTVMGEIDGGLKQEPMDMEAGESSIFGGGPSAASLARTRTGISQGVSDLDMHSSGSSLNSRSHAHAASSSKQPQTIKEDWERQLAPVPSLVKPSLWTRDSADEQSRINWKYLYTMRRRLESNWELGKFTNFQLPHPDYLAEGHAECIYSLQYDSKYLVSGSRDRSLKVWNLATRRLIRTLKKHRGSVLCLQFDSDPDEDIIVSGSSDSDVVIWKFSTGEEIQTLSHAHRESVLNVKFDKRILVTCSKDKTIKIFNRRELRHGDLGYKEVDPVPRNVVKYGFEDLPIIPPFSMIGCLEGHSAAVNAVQIHDREVVSASGDRHIKVWDWPTQVCTRTIVGHNKGIACVQYDGRRIVSGSSDNEVKVFDRQTGLEVASLRSHSNLVRTVQVGFGDLPYSIEDDAAEAKRVDDEYFKALQSGQVEEPRQGERRSRHGRRTGNAGSKRPEDIIAYGAKLPPGGGGGKYGRIVSGSYDTTIIIWRRDKEGIWKAQHHLRQEDAAATALRQGRSPVTAAPGTIPLHPSMRASVRQAATGGAGAGQPTAGSATPGQPTTASTGAATTSATGASNTSPRTQSASAPPATGRSSPPPATAADFQATQVEAPIFATLTPSSIQSYRQMVDIAVPAGPTTLAQTLATYPNILTQRNYISSIIDREPSPFVRSQLRQVVGTAMIRTQFEQARQRREAIRNQELAQENGGEASSSSSHAQASSSQAGASSSAAVPGATSSATAGAGPSRPADAASAAPSAAAVPTAQPMNIPLPTGATAISHAAAIAAAQNARGRQGLHLHQVSSPSPPPVPATPAPAHHHPHQATPPPADGGVASQQPQTANVPAQTVPPPPPPPQVQNHRHRDAANSARVFKLQYDARRIICCSQTSVIVGWDFCNGDPELEEASRFFAAVQ